MTILSLITNFVLLFIVAFIYAFYEEIKCIIRDIFKPSN